MKTGDIDHKRDIKVINSLKYSRLAKQEYRILYKKQKWTIARQDPSSGFCINDGNDEIDNEKKGNHQ